jgi:undecaprenyl-diphosphatase
MKNRNRKLWLAVCLLIAFALWTVLVQHVDVQPIGPNGSAVGFAMLNQFVHTLTGVHMCLYTVTDWAGLVPVALAFGFAMLGLKQLCTRKSLLRVDRSILALGLLYIAVIALYLLFETVVINRRPVLIDGILEASYPSSTTLLVLCVMPSAAMQFHARIKKRILRRCVTAAIILFTAFTVIGRLLSGVHWFTDIVGGVLVSAGLVVLYAWGQSSHHKEKRGCRLLA